MPASRPCPGCGALLPPEDGPTHPYMIGSAACWRMFGELLANDYSDRSAWPSHRFAVDAYAVQHPGGRDRQAIQSVGLPLARLCVTLDRDVSVEKADRLMKRLAADRRRLEWQQPPRSFAITVADVLPAVATPRHHEAIRDWARSAWEAWSHAHDGVRAYAAAALADD